MWFLSVIQALAYLVAPDVPLAGGAADSLAAQSSERKRLHEADWEGYADVGPSGLSRFEHACREIVVLFASENGLRLTEVEPNPTPDADPAQATTLVIEELDLLVSPSADRIDLSTAEDRWTRGRDHGSPAEILQWLLAALNSLLDARAEDPPRSTPVRSVVMLNIGPPFGGFRLAGRPGMFGLDQPAAFAALEDAIEKAYTLLAAHSPEAWPGLSPRGNDAAVPRLGDREGIIDATGTATSDAPGTVVLRACFPFRYWPFGGWVVFDGRHRSAEGAWRPFTEKELDKLW